MSYLLLTNLLGLIGMSAGALGMWLTGNHRQWGWAVAFGSEVVCLAWDVVLRQWAVIPFCLMYAVIFARNFLKWKHEERK